MTDRLKEFLFSKYILVNDTGENKAECFPTVFALAHRFGIRITQGMELAVPEMIRFAAEQMGQSVPEPFYRGFPESVKKLTPQERLYDQLMSYALTYGLNDFSETRHSLFEEPFERIAFQEKTGQTGFRILREEAAAEKLNRSAESLLSGSRPMSDSQFNMVCDMIREYGFRVTSCGSKDTASRLLLRFQDPSYAEFLRLPDVIHFAEILNHEENGQENIRKMNLSNRQRKLITCVLDRVLAEKATDKDICECYEKRALWTGLLHHIHYVPKSDSNRQFVDEIRNAKGNRSAPAAFENEMSAGNPVRAARTLKNLKGSGAVIRNLNYILSRCRTREEVNSVLDTLGTVSPILSIQMLLQYRGYTTGQRVFRFVRFSRVAKHTETAAEQERRRSVISPEICSLVTDYLRENLRKTLSANRIGKVYLDEGMTKIALPLQEASSSSGIGVLPKGTRLPMPAGDKLRCFTYWERADDIDLSCFGILENGASIEFSWRTAWDTTGTDAIAFSGDITSGFNGGSEYFDIDPEVFRAQFRRCGILFLQIMFIQTWISLIVSARPAT